MDEYALGYQAVAGVFGVVIASLFYMLGGRSGKWVRRYLASFILAGTVNILFAMRGTWHPWYIIIWPTLIGGFSVGYGADNLGAKILRRFVYAFAVCSSGIFLAVVSGNVNLYWLTLPHIFVASVSVFLGVKNILPAAVEEVMVCMVLNLFLIAYPLVGA